MQAISSAPVQTGPGTQATSYTVGSECFPRVKRPGRGVDHPPPSSDEAKETVELYSYSPSFKDSVLYFEPYNMLCDEQTPEST